MHITPMTTHLPRWTLACTLTLAATLLAGCGGDGPEKLLASARTYLAKGELRPAVIELKTLLQKTPDSPEARFLLGKALLASDEPVVAEVELRKALDLKHPRQAVLPELARAMLDQGKQKEIISQFSTQTLDDKLAQARLKTTLGWAHARSGAAPLADAAFKQALEAVPGHVPAQVGMARQLAIQGDRDAALKVVNGIIAAGTADAETWLLQGDLLAFGKSDRDGAIAAYRKAIVAEKANLTAHAGIIVLQMSSGDGKAAGEQVAELQKVRPGHPMTGFFQAQLAFEKGDFKSAKELVSQLLKVAPDHPQVNQLAGAIELASGSVAVARVHLSKTLKANPEAVAARRMLAAAYLKSGESSKALELLEPMLAQSPSDGVFFAMAGEAHMQAGDLDKASAMFSRAALANPKNTTNLTALARTRFLKGDTLGAVADLQRIAASDTGSVADLELVNAQLRRRDFQGALKAIDGLESKQPGKPLGSLLRGAAYLGLKDTAQARASFEKALAQDAAFFPAAFNLATLDIADKKPQAAQQRFDAVLKAQPGHLRALLSLADLRARNGASQKEVTDLLTTAVRLNPTQAPAHLSLINNHLVNKQAEPALAAAQQADAALPDQPSILDALGRAQLAAGQRNQALATFNKLAAAQPGNALAHMRVADINLAMKDSEAAIQSLKRAIAAKPDFAPALLRLFALEVQAGRSAEALKLARDLQKRQPAQSMGFVLEGDAHRAQKNNDAALVAYKAALGKAAPSDAATRYHGLLTATGKKAEADQFAKSWAKDHANDVVFAVYLGDAALGRRDMADAEVAYRRVIELQPNHAAALNNIAWLMVKTDKPGALSYAEKANALVPNQPALMDTLAMALAAEKKLDQALEIQKKALALAPDSNVVRLGLARLYVQAGQKAQARDLLEPLSKLGKKFPEHAEVKSLVAGL